MNDWNPDLYMQFSSERTQPSMDLITRIKAVEPASIIDIGCGPGNSTQVLVDRWPKAEITGLDRSAAMIKKAKQDYPHQEWIIGDALTGAAGSKYDIVFSNAAIQWIPDHAHLLKIFHGMLTDKGLVAIQIPLFWDMPLGKIIEGVARMGPWQDAMAGVRDLFTIHDHSFYYDHLSALFSSVEMWETHYFHVLKSHISILKMMRSTGLKPYLERLDSETEIAEFEEEVLREIENTYPKQMNAKVLLPFKRLFLIGFKSPDKAK